jgi:peptidyl-prolyl cis-trans isomerase SurA
VSKSRPQVRRPVQVAVASLLLAGGLSGCGVAGTSFQPGVAARVGDDNITVRQVDSLASGYCSSIEKQLGANNQVVPGRYLRGGIVGQLVLVSAARQLAAQYGVQPGADYTRKVADLRDAVANLPAEQAQAVVAVESSSAYLQGVVTAIGEKELQRQGSTASGSDAAVSAGKKVFSRWLDDHDVRIDPKFGVRISQGQPVPTDGSLSYAVSDAAKQGDAAQPDQLYAASLPDAHRCG